VAIFSFYSSAIAPQPGQCIDLGWNKKEATRKGRFGCCDLRRWPLLDGTAEGPVAPLF